MRDYPLRQPLFLRRVAVLALVSTFLASCTAVMEPDVQAGMPGYQSTAGMTDQGSADGHAVAENVAPAEGQPAEGDALPTQVAALPSSNPNAAAPAQPTGFSEQGQVVIGGSPVPDSEEGAAPSVVQPIVPPAAAPAPAAAAFASSRDRDGGGAVATKPRAPAAAPAIVDPSGAGDAVVDSAAGGTPTTGLTEAAEPEQPAPTVVEREEPAAPAMTAFAFSRSRDGGAVAAKPRARAARIDPASAGDGSVASATPASSGGRNNFRVASVEKASTSSINLDIGDDGNPRSSGFSGGDGLPGVRKSALFEIKRRSGLDDDADVDIYEEDDYGPVQMASAAGMARLAPNGLKVQTENVDVACLKPSLVRVLKQIERHYGQVMVVTSGYRSPSHNRRARGAKNSLHMYCAAADIQVPGVGKWELASYARTMSGRGGVGTYCHTNSVHVDVGPERDWNWRCRGRRRK